DFLISCDAFDPTGRSLEGAHDTYTCACAAAPLQLVFGYGRHCVGSSHIPLLIDFHYIRKNPLPRVIAF
ncbi:MAG: hypothetical protein P8X82_16380, partial [Gemmatimonadales bacterium]